MHLNGPSGITRVIIYRHFLANLIIGRRVELPTTVLFFERNTLTCVGLELELRAIIMLYTVFVDIAGVILEFIVRHHGSGLLRSLQEMLLPDDEITCRATDDYPQTEQHNTDDTNDASSDFHAALPASL